MSKNNRDDFLAKVKNRLKERVNSCCSNPDCRVPTSAPSDESDEAVNSIGIAAHICAAAGGKGARRYDSKMTSEQRKSINNGIWLCSKCADMIDNDEITYTVELLKQWKKQAEETAKLEQGRKPPRKEDAIDNLKMAFGVPTKKILIDAIDNVHKASSKSLEMLDPRFTVKTFYDGDITEFLVRPKENVNSKIKINENYKMEFKKQLLGLINYGEDIKINNEAINIEGLPILELFLSECIGTVIFAPTEEKKRRCMMKLWFTEPETNKFEAFDDIHGEIRVGNKGFIFNGSACQGLFCITLKIDNTDDDAKSTLNILFEKWNNIDIRKLPYFNKILSFYSKLIEKWELHGGLEIEGNNLSNFKYTNYDNIQCATYYDYLKYIEFCQKISKFANCKVLFLESYDCSYEQYHRLSDIVDTIYGKIYKKDEYSISINWTVPENFENEYIIDSMEKSSRLLFEYTERHGETIELFNIEIKLPPRAILIKSVIAEIDKDISDLKVGDVVQINLMPQENFSCKVSYQNSNNW